MKPSERRHHARREMRRPITFCPLGERTESPGIYYGKIIEVSGGGARVWTHSNFGQTTGSKLALFVLPDEVEDETNPELLVEITGEIVWRNTTTNCFGLKFL